MTSPQKILITGGCGLVGYAAYTHLSRQPERYAVYGLDRRRDLSPRTPGAWRNEIPADRFFLCDLTDFDGIRHAVAGMDVVVHLAADPRGKNWESLRDNNLVGAYHVFQACAEAGVQRIVADRMLHRRRRIAALRHFLRPFQQRHAFWTQTDSNDG